MTDVCGSYVYTFPSGEVEYLTLKGDGLYEQRLFRSEEEHRKGAKALHTNNNGWGLDGNEVVLYDWLQFCEYPDVRRMLPSPVSFHSSRGRWFREANAGPVLIQFSEEFQYSFRRTDDSAAERASNERVEQR